MPEYFDISLIINRTKDQESFVAKCLLDKLHLDEGENNIGESKYALLAHKKTILGIYQDDNVDFQEICISIPDFVFHKKTFDQELNQVTSFVEECFKLCDGIKLVVCGYETNAYLIWNLSKIEEFTPDFLLKFPIVYLKQQSAKIDVITNLKAQDIFI